LGSGGKGMGSTGIGTRTADSKFHYTKMRRNRNYRAK